MNLTDRIINTLETNLQITLPSFGKFNLVLISSQKENNRIMPPRYTVIFTQQHNLNDDSIIQEIAISNSITYQEAKERLDNILTEWKNELKEKLYLHLNKLGTFRLEKENIFFLPAEDCFCNTKNFGLPSLDI